MQSHRHRVGNFVVVLTLSTVAGLVWWWGRGYLDRRGQLPPAGSVTESQSERPPPPESPAPDAHLKLQAAAESLKGASGSGESRRTIAELRTFFLSLSRTEAATAIAEFLESGSDAITQLDFIVGPDGFLLASPSFRVFLLDLLGQIDPKAASACAKVILARMDSPDEWAVALRNVARGDPSPEGVSFLSARVGELLRHEPWWQHPAASYLEAFDVAVHLGATNHLPALTDLVRRQDNPALAHAAYLTLDRLVIQDAAAALRWLGDNPGLLAGREKTRANYFARADVRDSQQKVLLEDYLLDPTRSSAELNAFVGLFPNANYMVSHNLLTEVQTPNGETLLARDRAALTAVESWLADPRFATLRPQLEILKSRLEEFARQTTEVKR